MKASFVNECPSWSFPAEYESEHRFSISDHVKPDTRFGRFLRRNAILLIGLAALIIWTWATTAIAAHNARQDTIEELTAIHEQEIEQAVQAVRDEYAAKRFVSGEASKQAAMAGEAGWVAKMLYGIKDNSEADLRTAVWCVLNRVDNPWYPNSVQEVVEQKEQWMGYSGDNPILTDLKDLALEEIEKWYDGERPCGIEFVYLYWTPTKVTLRDSWQDGSTTNYWRA